MWFLLLFILSLRRCFHSVTSNRMMSPALSALLLIVSSRTVNGIISDCPESQLHSTHLVCEIFKNTNIDEVFGTMYNFTDDNYCVWAYTGDEDKYINCTSGNSISDIVLYRVDINGTLDLTFPWPSTLRKLDLEQDWGASTELFGEWNWTSFEKIVKSEFLEVQNEHVHVFFSILRIYHYSNKLLTQMDGTETKNMRFWQRTKGTWKICNGDATLSLGNDDRNEKCNKVSNVTQNICICPRGILGKIEI